MKVFRYKRQLWQAVFQSAVFIVCSSAPSAPLIRTNAYHAYHAFPVIVGTASATNAMQGHVSSIGFLGGIPNYYVKGLKETHTQIPDSDATGPGWKDYYRETFTFDSQDNITRVKLDRWDDSLNRLSDYWITDLSYHVTGKLAEQTGQELNLETHKWVYVNRLTFSYDQNDSVIGYAKYDFIPVYGAHWDSIPSITGTVTYNALKQNDSVKLNFRSGDLTMSRIYVYTYLPDGKFDRETRYDTRNSGTDKFVTTHTYPDGETEILVDSAFYQFEECVLDSTLIKYNDAGQVIERKNFNWTSLAPDTTHFWEETSDQLTEYDDQKRPLIQRKRSSTGQIIEQKLFTYSQAKIFNPFTGSPAKASMISVKASRSGRLIINGIVNQAAPIQVAVHTLNGKTIVSRNVGPAVDGTISLGLLAQPAKGWYFVTIRQEYRLLFFKNLCIE